MSVRRQGPWGGWRKHAKRGSGGKDCLGTMEQRDAGDSGHKEEVDKFEEEEEDAAIVECQRKQTQNIAS